MIRFETIGNATTTIFDNSKPVLSTDSWLLGNPYFGNWDQKYLELSKIYKNFLYLDKLSI